MTRGDSRPSVLPVTQTEVTKAKVSQAAVREGAGPVFTSVSFTGKTRELPQLSGRLAWPGRLLSPAVCMPLMAAVCVLGQSSARAREATAMHCPTSSCGSVTGFLAHWTRFTNPAPATLECHT